MYMLNIKCSFIFIVHALKSISFEILKKSKKKKYKLIYNQNERS